MKLPSHLLEAQRLLDADMRLVKLHNNEKRPIGEAWNASSNFVTKIDPNATGYGIPLAANDLCSLDPDNVELAEKGLAALGFNLEDWMNAGVRTCSTRIGSGGRSAFRFTQGLTWLKFSSKETGTVLELRAASANLQDCCPGVQYLTKDGQTCSQDYDPFSEYLFDNPPFLPDSLYDWWHRCSTDVEFLRDQQQKFFEAIGANAHLAISSGEGSLAYPSRLRIDYNKSHTVTDILSRHGYTEAANGRWAPATATGAPAVRLIPNKDGLWHSDHASDPLFGTFDAWTAYVVLDHNGDVDAAERALGECILDEFEVLGEDGALVSGFDALEAEAHGVVDRDTLKAFAEKVSAVRNEVLSDGDRTVLAGIVAKAGAFKGVLTAAAIKKMLRFAPPKIVDHRDRPKYERNDDGEIMTTTGNIVLAFQSEGEIGMRFTYDSFTDDYRYSVDGGEWKPIHDEHYVALQIRLEKLGIYGVTSQKVRECLQMVCREGSIDTAQMWLDGLEWDGVPRVKRFFIDYFGAAESEYVEAVGVYIWTALAARVMVPGHQVDMVPVLVGAQGVRKTTGIVAMCPSREFFGEFLFGDNETEAARKMRGCLIGELAELRGLRSKEKEHIKAWLTRTHEEVRKLYENTVRKVPRRLCFIGTTNDDQFLDEDPSGQRRWLPVNVTGGDVDAIARDRDMLWAEGRELFAAGGVAFADAERLAREIHSEFIAEDPYEPEVLEWLANRSECETDWVTTNDIMNQQFKLPADRKNSAINRRIGQILKKHRYFHTRIRVHGIPTWVFRKKLG